MPSVNSDHHSLSRNHYPVNLSWKHVQVLMYLVGEYLKLLRHTTYPMWTQPLTIPNKLKMYSSIQTVLL